MPDFFVKVTQSDYEINSEYKEVSSQSGTTSTNNAPDFNDHTIFYTTPDGRSIEIFAHFGGVNDRYFGLGLGSSQSIRNQTAIAGPRGGVNTITETDDYTFYGLNGSVSAPVILNSAPQDGPLVTIAPPAGTTTIVNVDGTTYTSPINNPSFSYPSYYWLDLGAAKRETYKLNFVFVQQPSSTGQIQAGTLTAVITGSYGDTQSFSTDATTDDALPLKSGDASITAKISQNFMGNDLVFDLSGLSANPNQKNVELHGGHITDYGQISGDSQSCVIAQSGFMPKLLTTLTQDYQNSLGYAASSSDDVASWINSSCSPTMTSANALSQALLSVQNAPKQGGLLFSLSRTLEKVVKVLFDVTDERTGDTTVREAFIQPNTQSTVISFASLFNNGKNAGLGDHYLTNPDNLSSYESHYIVKIPGADTSDSFDVSIDAYQILYQGGRSDGRPADYNPWYFDTKNGANNSGTNVSGEYLMFGSRTTTSFTM